MAKLTIEEIIAAVKALQRLECAGNSRTAAGYSCRRHLAVPYRHICQGSIHYRLALRGDAVEIHGHTEDNNI